MSEVKLQITIKDVGLCPRYQAVVMELPAKLGAKYLSKMTTDIAKAGMRAIDSIVDATNYLMLLTGQPLHAFDYDKLVKVGGREDAHIIVRAAKDGEKMTLLDGKEIAMGEGDIVITSNDVPVALAGAMGGANTAIDENTRRIVVESATFNLYNLRGTQFRHGIFSEAITRFTKGQPAALTDFVIREFINMTERDLGLKVISDVVDAYPKPVKPSVVKITTEQVNGLLGTSFSFDDIITTLENVGFKVKLISGDITTGLLRSARNDTRGARSDKSARDDSTDGVLVVKAPWWRTDIHIAEDGIEEVGRLNGYDEIPTQLPQRGFASPVPDALGDLKTKIRRILAEAGANEVLTYSFVSEKLLENVGQDPKNSYQIINSISPELQYVRQQIVPNLLEKAQENLRAGYDKFALFEMNQVFSKNAGLTAEKVPEQWDNLGLVIIDSDSESNYYIARKYATDMAAKLGLDIKFVPRKTAFEIAPYFETKRAADLYVGDERVGMVAEIKGSVADKFKLPRGLAAIEMGVDLILDVLEKSAKKSGYNSQSRFPSVERDLTFRVISDLEYTELENLLCKNLEERKLWFQLLPISIYQGDDSKTKNISFRLNFADYEKTLTGREIADIMDEIAKKVKKELGGEVI
jgi:phenylalanyl-tRNA synthetase beta chain